MKKILVIAEGAAFGSEIHRVLRLMENRRNIEATKDTYLAYAKKKLNPVYLNEPIKKSILDQMERVKFIMKCQ